MSSDVLEHARKKIDAEILELQERIRSLHSSRNALAPISCLPPEVMSQIFLWLQRLYQGIPRYDSSYFTSFPKWIWVTHVSEHWKRVAFTSKTLFSTILTPNLRYSREMLKNSGCTALTLVDSAKTNWNSKELQELVIPILPRLRSLSLHPRSREVLLPHLEKLNLSLERLNVSSWDTLTPSMFPHSLRQLDLCSCGSSFYGSLPSLSNLVKLSLVNPNPEIVDGMKMDMFLDILDGMPQLISLEFAFMLDPTPGQIDRASHISPRLQYFKLLDTPDNLARFIPWMRVEPQCIMDL